MANIKYVLDGGTLNGTEQQITHLGKEYYLLPAAAKEGSTFLGWFDEAGQRIVAVKDGLTARASWMPSHGLTASGQKYFYLGRCPQQEMRIADPDLALALKSSEQVAFSRGLITYYQKTFFTFDPVRWIVLGASDGGKTLAVAEKVLDTRQYDAYRFQDERYKTQSDDFAKLTSSAERIAFVVNAVSAGPDIRQALLDDAFFVFTPDEKAKLALLPERGNDPLFLLEVRDAQNPAFFAETSLSGPAPSRIAFPTDYAKAGHRGYDVLGVDGSAWYWTSSEMADWHDLYPRAFSVTAEEKKAINARLGDNLAHWPHSKAMLVGEDASKEKDLIYYIDFSYDSSRHDQYVNTGSISYGFKDYHFGGLRPALLLK